MMKSMQKIVEENNCLLQDLCKAQKNERPGEMHHPPLPIPTPATNVQELEEIVSNPCVVS